jgi:hypothetical protein
MPTPGKRRRGGGHQRLRTPRGGVQKTGKRGGRDARSRVLWGEPLHKNGEGALVGGQVVASGRKFEGG